MVPSISNALTGGHRRGTDGEELISRPLGDLRDLTVCSNKAEMGMSQCFGG